MHDQTETSPKIQLPLSIIDRVDVARLLRELDALNNFFETAAVRDPDTKPKMPKTSRHLDEIIQQNKLDALLKADRERLKKFLDEIRAEAPIIHISFSADPSPLFSQKLVAWLRDKIHPLMLLQVGLQPTIGAGCIVRTTNKQFDFSLRQRLISEKDVLIKKMREVDVNDEAEPIAPNLDLPPVQAEPETVQAIAPTSPDTHTNPSDQPVVPLAPAEEPQNENK